MQPSAPHFFESFQPPVAIGTQAERRNQLIKMTSHFARQCFSSNGIWTHPVHSPDARERIWICFGLMLGSDQDVALANAILDETRFKQNTDNPCAKDFIHPFDIFVSNHCVQMVVLHSKKLQPAVLKKMESWARIALNDYPGNRQADLQFHGYNDNMPSKAAMGMILGGEYFGDQAAIEHGLWSLHQLRDMLTRRGMVSEFNSPTYSPLTIGNLTEIAKYAHNNEARLLADQCVQRVWADVLGRFHPNTGLSAGPYTRAYTVDSVGHLSSLNFILWLTFGEGVWPNPLEEIRSYPPRLVLHHEGDLFFVIAQKCWLAAFEYHPPAYLVEWMKSRRYPFTVVATAERAEGGPDAWYASEILATTYQHEDFALGTSEGDWGSFQPDECVVQYRRHQPARSVADVRTGFTKFLINDDGPGKLHPNHNGLFTGEKDFVKDYGFYHTIQKDGVAMVVVGPDVRLSETPLSKMGFAFILPEHLSTIDRIEFADGHVWLQDGPFFLALRPLGATPWGGTTDVSIEKVNRYRVVWMPNYQGPKRTFTRKELAGTVNGFVLAASSKSIESFAAFRARLTTAKVLDYHFGGTRTVRYQLGDLDMSINYGTFSHQPRFMTINGKIVPHPLWEATGLPADKLPFLNEKPALNSMNFPFKSLRVAAVPDDPWQIFSRND